MEVVRPERAVQQMALQIEAVPAYDLPISLAAAANPGRYEMPASWARSVRQSLPSAVRADLTFFFGGPKPLGVGPIQLLPDLQVTEPAAFILALEEMDGPSLAAALLTHYSGGKPLTAALRRKARGRELSEADEGVLAAYLGALKADTRRRFRAILQTPDDMRRRYLALLRAHHEAWFGPRYPEVLPFLQQRAKQARRSIGKLPPEEVIARVTGGFTLQSPLARSVTLVPSWYASPFVFVVRDGRDVVLVYGARPAQAEEPPSAIKGQSVRVLKALADETRLRILQLLAQRPLYGQQLADALGVSHPTISHHMTQLRIAGLTRTEMAEDGAQRYSVRPEALEDLFGELRTALIEREGR